MARVWGGRHANALAERRVRMNCLADVHRIGAHFNRQSDFTDHVACMRADNAAADDAVRFLVKQQFGITCITPIGNGPA